jgi:GH25 family lysozyme M1 (1,4-beta-N-acetylmuramidase)
MNLRAAKYIAVGVVGLFGCVASSGEKTGSTASDLSICASTMIEGVDVSYYDGTVDWASVKASGRQFAIARVSDGTGFMDPQFATNWSGIKAAGMVRGVYQFYRPEDDAVAQAKIVISAVGSIGAGDLPPVLDVEVTDGESNATVVDGITTWVSQIRSSLGVEPMIYASPGFWEGLSGTSGLSDTYYWDANWGVSCPELASPWSSFEVWQYSDTGSVPGISDQVDLDRFNGTEAQLLAFAGGGGGGGGGTDAGSPDTGSPDTGGGKSSAPDACDQGPGFCTATLQCDAGHWIVRKDDASACTTVDDVEEPCSQGDGYCTATLQCDAGNWVPRSDDPDACTSGPGA